MPSKGPEHTTVGCWSGSLGVPRVRSRLIIAQGPTNLNHTTRQGNRTPHPVTKPPDPPSPYCQGRWSGTSGLLTACQAGTKWQHRIALAPDGGGAAGCTAPLRKGLTAREREKREETRGDHRCPTCLDVKIILGIRASTAAPPHTDAAMKVHQPPGHQLANSHAQSAGDLQGMPAPMQTTTK